MEVGGGGGDGGVVGAEEAVKALVEQLVRPLLPARRALSGEGQPTPEKHEAVARQMYAAVILYNYYHRKQFPQLAFADVKEFFTHAAVAAGEPLLIYLNIIHDHDCCTESGEPEKLPSVTDKAIMHACGIADALDATKDYPNMTKWPLSKVAVFLVNQIRGSCLLQHSSMTQGVWSLIEKEIVSPVGKSRNNQPTKRASKDKAIASTSDEAYRNELKQLAFSEVEHKTGIKPSSLHVIEEHLTYSLSKRETTTMLFVVQYEKIMNDELREMPVQVLINSLQGPVVKNDPLPTTTSVVDFYHILPYKEILFDCVQRGWHSDPSTNVLKLQPDRNEKYSLDSEIDENLNEEEGNSRSPREEQTPKVSTQKKSKNGTKETGINSNSNSSSNNKNISSTTANIKRKSKASRTIAADNAEGWCGSCPPKAKEPPVLADGETMEFFTNSLNVKPTEPMRDMDVQMDKSREEKHSVSGNIPKDEFTAKEARVDPATEIVVVENLTREVSGKTDGVTSSDQMYASLQSLWIRRDDFHQKRCIIEDQVAQCETDIQTILAEGDMTPKVVSIIERYKHGGSSATEINFPSCSEERCQVMNIKRRRLSEAVLKTRSLCQELDEICRLNNWILPRYIVPPSETDGMFEATVYIKGLDFDANVAGDKKITPSEARESAAANMISKLWQMAKSAEPDA